ncbi:hypothetical protein HUJ04_010155 [Dendroctonus ponderosae]|nr:hypothetical protein HUJ04_010155 [Dendroctonus ponderosae]
MKIVLPVVIISLCIGDLVQTQEFCANLTCSGAHQVCGISNSCLNKCRHLVQMQEACADIKCSSPHQICRGSNPCYNKCSSQFCPAYLEYACFCESEAEVEVSLDFDIQKSQTYLKCCRHLIIAFRKKYSEDGKTNLDVAKDLVLKKHSVKRRKDAYLQAKKELP